MPCLTASSSCYEKGGWSCTRKGKTRLDQVLPVLHRTSIVSALTMTLRTTMSGGLLDKV